MMTAEEIRKRKEELGYSNVLLAERSGVPIGTISRIVGGTTKKPHYRTLQALESALNQAAYYYYDTAKKQILCMDQEAEYQKTALYRVQNLTPTIAHQKILGNFYTVLREYLEKEQPEYEVFFAPVLVKLKVPENLQEERDIRELLVTPDLAIVKGKDHLTSWGVDGTPEFILEVTSEETGAEDYIKKTQVYLDTGVREYWIIDPGKRILVQYCFEKAFAPVIRDLEGKTGIGIFGDRLKIDLTAIRNLL